MHRRPVPAFGMMPTIEVLRLPREVGSSLNGILPENTIERTPVQTLKTAVGRDTDAPCRQTLPRCSGGNVLHPPRYAGAERWMLTTCSPLGTKSGCTAATSCVSHASTGRR